MSFAGDRAERERITRVYERYERTGFPRDLWSDGPAMRHIREVKWRTVEALAAGCPAWRNAEWAIDIGSGPRSELTEPGIGARPAAERVLALDLMASATQSLGGRPGVHPVLGQAACLPVATGSARLVWQSMMISSVLDPGLRARIYAEIARVTAPGGLFVSYDTRYANPWNPDTRPVVLNELRRAFPGWHQRHRTLTGLPPLLRWLAPASRGLCRVVETIPLLRSHRLFVAEKPAGGRAGQVRPA